MAIAFIRTIILYFVIIFGLRLLGKRQVGELEPSELVLSLLIADLAAVPMQDFGIPLIAGIIPIMTLLSVTMILSVLTMKSVRLRVLLCGKPSIIVRDGQPVPQEMHRTRFTVDELLEELRMKGYTDISKIKYAILETNGQLSILPYANQKPPTVQQLNLSTKEAGLPLVLISDGCLLEQNLTLSGHDRSWLEKQLSKHGCSDPKQAFLLTVDEQGQVYFARRDKGVGA